MHTKVVLLVVLTVTENRGLAASFGVGCTCAPRCEKIWARAVEWVDFKSTFFAKNGATPLNFHAEHTTSSVVHCSITAIRVLELQKEV
mmetsp:Transcript_93236/g.269269  ORF Transcript_93236/g.269269 Transcript_93236/m.269269 type:complete len:88 (-) Transcript_93236:144-407(-)